MNIGITKLDEEEAHDIEPMTWRGNVFTCMHDYIGNYIVHENIIICTSIYFQDIRQL